MVYPLQIIDRVNAHGCYFEIKDLNVLVLKGDTKKIQKELLKKIRENKLALIRHIRNDVPCFVVEGKERESSEWTELAKFMYVEMGLRAIASYKQSMYIVRLRLLDGGIYDAAKRQDRL
ncbi:MAG: hypothetical protein HQL75_00460 [Magnetococcales bacterium]|nr:hypothetical protein [Magnetococcales bacterium]